jgi:hypothetical protein
MPSNRPDVLRLGYFDRAELCRLLAGYRIELCDIAPGKPIPGSFWGDDEAGLIGHRLYARSDTPLHSILHEASHFICLDPTRRTSLDRDAGSDDAEESAVCYLQILLADELPSMGRDRMFTDMDCWGYSFRLGSARAWFEYDAGDALEWLSRFGLVADRRPSLRLRQC